MVFGITKAPTKTETETKTKTNAESALDTDLYNPAKLHPLSKVDEDHLEYLDLETNQKQAEGLIASRGYLEDLSYGTGAMYMLGLGFGGMSGLVLGLRSTQPTMNPKLRFNAILNSITKRGPYVGNLCGCLTLTYNFVNGAIDLSRGKHDDAGSLAAGAITGALWNGSRGVRPMLVSTALLTSASAGWCIFKRVVTPQDDEE